MNKNKLNHFKELLQKDREKRLKSVTDKTVGLNISMKDETGELSSYDNHPGDLGTETFEAEKNVSFRIRDSFFIREIDDALERIDEGTFGTCESCGSSVDVERLELLPYARMCVHCEKEHEKIPVGEEHGRPIEEQVLFPGFGRSFRDYTVNDETGYDGEDAWQDVNEYNVVTSDNNFEHEDGIGTVEEIEKISNEQYKRQL